MNFILLAGLRKSRLRLCTIKNCVQDQTIKLFANLCSILSAPKHLSDTNTKKFIPTSYLTLMCPEDLFIPQACVVKYQSKGWKDNILQNSRNCTTGEIFENKLARNFGKQTQNHLRRHTKANFRSVFVMNSKLDAIRQFLFRKKELGVIVEKGGKLQLRVQGQKEHNLLLGRSLGQNAEEECDPVCMVVTGPDFEHHRAFWLFIL